MALYHFAKIDDNNLVIGLTVVDGSDCNNGDEATGVTFLTNLTGWSNWKKYDPDTHHGKHDTGGTPYRGNSAEIGATWLPDTEEFKPVNGVVNGVWDDTEKRLKDPADGTDKPTDPIS